ncbi:hypothetical protein EV586_102724 [Tumebacillus sp. BK434]|uniref:hypothetical protein n=1 Tax=Tumebacillus sp. BK434 TaxID=2512169 RepID=UPI001052351E|nr:hypothetical protein [Tumebacillus sp. BK434]TCP58270.1 hypothetical protein EV586_102724 [Tumebacillus sp. BK434]
MSRELEFGRVAVEALQVLADAVEQDATRRGAGERQAESFLAGQVSAWLEQYAGAPLWERRKELGLQLRSELMDLLSGMEPQLATALLCGLPGAARRGYSAQRLAGSLGVEAVQIAAWEAQAYARLGELATERTPLLAFLQARVGEGGEASYGAQTDSLEVSTQDTSHHAEGLQNSMVSQDGCGSHEAGRFVSDVTLATVRQAEVSPSALSAEAVAGLLKSARAEADFDLRTFVSAGLELRIRQAFHRFGRSEQEQVESLFSEEERAAVALIGARMTLEMNGEEETADG